MSTFTGNLVLWVHGSVFNDNVQDVVGENFCKAKLQLDCSINSSDHVVTSVKEVTDDVFVEWCSSSSFNLVWSSSQTRASLINFRIRKVGQKSAKGSPADVIGTCVVDTASIIMCPDDRCFVSLVPVFKLNLNNGYDTVTVGWMLFSSFFFPKKNNSLVTVPTMLQSCDSAWQHLKCCPVVRPAGPPPPSTTLASASQRRLSIPLVSLYVAASPISNRDTSKLKECVRRITSSQKYVDLLVDVTRAFTEEHNVCGELSFAVAVQVSSSHSQESSFVNMNGTVAEKPVILTNFFGRHKCLVTVPWLCSEPVSGGSVGTNGLEWSDTTTDSILLDVGCGSASDPSFVSSVLFSLVLIVQANASEDHDGNQLYVWKGPVIGECQLCLPQQQFQSGVPMAVTVPFRDTDKHVVSLTFDLKFGPITDTNNNNNIAPLTLSRTPVDSSVKPLFSTVGAASPSPECRSIYMKFSFREGLLKASSAQFQAQPYFEVSFVVNGIIVPVSCVLSSATGCVREVSKVSGSTYPTVHSITTPFVVDTAVEKAADWVGIQCIAEVSAVVEAAHKMQVSASGTGKKHVAAPVQVQLTIRCIDSLCDDVLGESSLLLSLSNFTSDEGLGQSPIVLQEQWIKLHKNCPLSDAGVPLDILENNTFGKVLVKVEKCSILVSLQSPVPTVQSASGGNGSSHVSLPFISTANTKQSTGAALDGYASDFVGIGVVVICLYYMFESSMGSTRADTVNKLLVTLDSCNFVPGDNEDAGCFTTCVGSNIDPSDAVPTYCAVPVHGGNQLIQCICKPIRGRCSFVSAFSVLSSCPTVSDTLDVFSEQCVELVVSERHSMPDLISTRGGSTIPQQHGYPTYLSNSQGGLPGTQSGLLPPRAQGSSRRKREQKLRLSPVFVPFVCGRLILSVTSVVMNVPCLSSLGQLRFSMGNSYFVTSPTPFSLGSVKPRHHEASPRTRLHHKAPPVPSVKQVVMELSVDTHEIFLSKKKCSDDSKEMFAIDIMLVGSKLPIAKESSQMDMMDEPSGATDANFDKDIKLVGVGHVSSASWYYPALRRCSSANCHGAQQDMEGGTQESDIEAVEVALVDPLHPGTVVATITMSMYFVIEHIPKKSVIDPIACPASVPSAAASGPEEVLVVNTIDDPNLVAPDFTLKSTASAVGVGDGKAAKLDMKLKKAFQLADVDESGSVSYEELVKVMESKNFESYSSDISSLLSTTTTGSKLFSQTLNASASGYGLTVDMNTGLMNNSSNNIRTMFDMMDLDGDGNISWWEWKLVLSTMFNLQQVQLQQSASVFSPVTGSGLVDYMDPLILSMSAANESLLSKKWKARQSSVTNNQHTVQQSKVYDASPAPSSPRTQPASNEETARLQATIQLLRKSNNNLCNRLEKAMVENNEQTYKGRNLKDYTPRDPYIQSTNLYHDAATKAARARNAADSQLAHVDHQLVYEKSKVSSLEDERTILNANLSLMKDTYRRIGIKEKAAEQLAEKERNMEYKELTMMRLLRDKKSRSLLIIQRFLRKQLMRIRRDIKEKKYQEMNLILNGLWRKKKKNVITVRQLFAVIFVQKRMRGRIARLKLERKTRAITLLQSVVRRKKCMKEFRKHKLRLFHMIFSKQHHAASVIQFKYRSFSAKRAKSAAVLQSKFRTFANRRAKVQANIKSEKLNKSVTALQSLARKRLNKRIVEEKIKEREEAAVANRAAILLQAQGRGRFQRDKDRKMKKYLAVKRLSGNLCDADADLCRDIGYVSERANISLDSSAAIVSVENAEANVSGYWWVRLTTGIANDFYPDDSSTGGTSKDIENKLIRSQPGNVTVVDVYSRLLTVKYFHFETMTVFITSLPFDHPQLVWKVAVDAAVKSAPVTPKKETPITTPVKEKETPVVTPVKTIEVLEDEIVEYKHGRRPLLSESVGRKFTILEDEDTDDANVYTCLIGTVVDIYEKKKSILVELCSHSRLRVEGVALPTPYFECISCRVPGDNGDNSSSSRTHLECSKEVLPFQSRDILWLDILSPNAPLSLSQSPVKSSEAVEGKSAITAVATVLDPVLSCDSVSRASKDAKPDPLLPTDEPNGMLKNESELSILRRRPSLSDAAGYRIRIKDEDAWEGIVVGIDVAKKSIFVRFEEMDDAVEGLPYLSRDIDWLDRVPVEPQLDGEAADGLDAVLQMSDDDDDIIPDALSLSEEAVTLLPTQRPVLDAAIGYRVQLMDAGHVKSPSIDDTGLVVDVNIDKKLVIVHFIFVEDGTKVVEELPYSSRELVWFPPDSGL